MPNPDRDNEADAPSHPGPFDLASTFVRLSGSDASAQALAVDADFWPRLARGELGDFHRQFLVSCHVFDGDWTTAEMHPNGDEVVCLLDGAVTFVLFEPGEGGDRTEQRAIVLERPGAFCIVPRGTWHTAKLGPGGRARVLFITAGEGTQHQPLA